MNGSWFEKMGILAAASVVVAATLVLGWGSASAATKHRCAAWSADRDHDRIVDCWEKRNGLTVGKADGRSDRDHDGMRALREFRADVATKADHSIFLPFAANDADSDDDGVEDGDDEGPGPDDDGDDEGNEEEVSGTIVSFDSATGLLTVQPDDGGDVVTGTVTASTEIEWDSEGEGPGTCGDEEEATTDDLQPGTAVEELEFNDDGTTLEEVELVCPDGGEEE